MISRLVMPYRSSLRASTDQRPSTTVAIGTPRTMCACGSKKISAWRTPCLLYTSSASGRYFHEDITAPFVLHGGRLQVPTGPGLGVEVRRDVVDRLTTRRSVVRPG